MIQCLVPILLIGASLESVETGSSHLNDSCVIEPKGVRKWREIPARFLKFTDHLKTIN